MTKIRVYELAKDLNTTSKRLMEKLSEIKIDVKNHMSLLEDNELKALYTHIGVIRHEGDKKTEEDAKKAVSPAVPNSTVKKEVKSGPRIIRTTEIIIDTKNENEPVKVDAMPRNEPRNNTRNGQRQEFVKHENTNSGLRPGFVRDGKPEYKKQTRTVIENARESEIKQGDMMEVKGKAHEKIESAENKVDKSTVPSVVKQEGELLQEAKKQENKQDANRDGVMNIDNKKQDAADTKNDTSAPVIVKENADSNQVSPGPSQVSEARQDSRPQGDRSQGYNRPQGDRPQGGYNNRPQGDRPQGSYNRPQGDRPQGSYNRPQGDRPQGDRPQGDRPQGSYNRPQGDRPQGSYNRPQGDRPQGGYNRPQGDGSQGGYNRPQGDSSQGGYNRPQGQGGYNRPQGDRPQGQGGYNRPQGDRPQGQGGYNRPQGDRPQGQGGYSRPQGDRPQGQGGYNRPQGDRPQGGYNRPQGDRPQGGYNNNRPQGDRPQGGYGDRQQGGYGNRPQGGGYGNKSAGARSAMDAPKPEMSAAQKEEMSQRTEQRRETQTKDFDKDIKREQKREVPKGGYAANERNKKFKPEKLVLGEKKGVSEVLSEDYILNEFYSNDPNVKNKKPARIKRDSRGRIQPERYIPPKAVLTSITIGESMTVKELAESLKKTSTEVIKKLMATGIMATLNQEVDFDTATIIADEFGIKTEKAIVVNEEDILFNDEEENPDKMVSRPPVVVVMGHVDHGKTSLLDAIRETNVIESEAGGITQHIGAYMVKINNKNITFLDTPGHEAFTAMRARGAQVTDIAILVVAADDGVMPQTIEAINHAKAANVSIIVAINKIDKPGANPDRVKQELTEYGIVAEEWGGDAIMVPVSAKKREHIDTLLEMVALAAEMLELKADPSSQAKGTIIEAKLDKDRGPTTSMLVQRGTLHIGDSIVTGTTVGRIRAMVDDKGHKIKKAGPSTPVEILGLSEVPEAGEMFYAITDEKVAKQLVEKRRVKIREQQMRANSRISLEDLFTQIKEGKVKDINIIVKADVQGSVEAVKQSLEKLTNDEVRVRIIHGGVGAITESDVTLAQVSSAIIIAFNVRPGTNVAEMAKNAEVDLRMYRVIYNAIEDVKAAMKGMLDPTFKEVILGHVEIRQIFKVSGIGTIGGCYVTDGKVLRNSDVRIVREGIVAHEGKLASLKRFKDDAKEVAQGYECGLAIEKFNDIREGDIVEVFTMEEVAR